MIDPSGDPKHTGRTIGDSFERGLTLQCAEALKVKLEQEYPYIRVIVTRLPGETLEPLQNIQFANRLAVDLYLNINFYEEIETVPKLFLFYYVQNKTTDVWYQAPNNLVFEPFDQAHRKSLKKTMSWAQQIKEVLEHERYPFEIKIMGLPFKPVKGIIAPALGIEMGLKQQQDWRILVQALVYSLKPIIEQCAQL